MAGSHIHVIVRFDFYLSDGDAIVIPADRSQWANHVDGDPALSLPTGVTTTKAYEDADVAWAEAERLNALREDGRSVYVVMLARLQRPAQSDDSRQ